MLALRTFPRVKKYNKKNIIVNNKKKMKINSDTKYI